MRNASPETQMEEDGARSASRLSVNERESTEPTISVIAYGRYRMVIPLRTAWLHRAVLITARFHLQVLLIALVLDGVFVGSWLLGFGYGYGWVPGLPEMRSAAHGFGRFLPMALSIHSITARTSKNYTMSTSSLPIRILWRTYSFVFLPRSQHNSECTLSLTAGPTLFRRRFFLKTLALGRFSGILPVVCWGRGKWLLIPPIRGLSVAVPVLTAIWVPFKAGLMFNEDEFTKAFGPDTRWMASLAFAFGVIFPVLEIVCLWKCAWLGREYIRAQAEVYDLRVEGLEDPEGEPPTPSTPLFSQKASITELYMADNMIYSQIRGELIDLENFALRASRRTANVLSRLFATWQFSLLRRGYRGLLDLNNVWHLTDEDAPARLSLVFKETLSVRKDVGKPADVKWTLFHVVKWDLFKALAWAFGQYTCMLVSPLLLKMMVKFIQSDCYDADGAICKACSTTGCERANWGPNATVPAWAEELQWGGLSWGTELALWLFLLNVIGAICQGQEMYWSRSLGMKMRNTMITSAYRRVLAQKVQDRDVWATGQVYGLITADAEIMYHAGYLAARCLITPYVVILGVYISVSEVGPAAMAGLGLLFAFVPVAKKLSNMQRSRQKETLKKTAVRTTHMNETVTGIKMIKMYAWLTPLIERVTKDRNEELSFLYRFSLIKNLTLPLAFIMPSLSSVLTFLVYAVTLDEGEALTADVAFTIVSIYVAITGPFVLVPMGLTAWAGFQVSIKKYTDYFSLTPRLRQKRLQPISSDHPTIKVDGGNFQWKSVTNDSEPSFSLENINFHLKQGELVAVVGPVGSGKSSFINAVLEEMVLKSGTVEVAGSIAYVPQIPFTLNDTLRANILFGKEFDAVRYAEVVNLCCLDQDLDALPAGDLTEIGERGVNLSGGQKMRVSIARAVYADSATIVLDDPLAAVDSHVAATLFYKLLATKLKPKAILLVTNQLQFLRDTSRVYVMDHGRIAESGTYDELAEIPDGHLASLLASTLGEVDQKDVNEEEAEIDELECARAELSALKAENYRRDQQLSKKKGDASEAGATLVQAESVMQGVTPAAVYKKYAFAGGGGSYKGAILAILVFLASEVTFLFNDYWLSIWSTAKQRVTAANLPNPDCASTNASYGGTDCKTMGYYVGVYSGLAVLFYVLVIWRSLSLVAVQMNTSRYYHAEMLIAVLKSPMAFFETTPAGRILNRFTRDIFELDFRVMDLWHFAVLSTFRVVIALIFIAVSVNLFGAFFVGFLVMYVLLFEYYRRTSRQLQRLEAVARSPVFNHVSETISGTEVIRAYAMETDYLNTHADRLDLAAKVYFAQRGVESWVGTWLGLIGSLVVLFCGLLLMIDPDTVGPGEAAMALSYSLSVLAFLNVGVRYASELEAKMNCVERISEYTTLVAEAPPFHGIGPPQAWPQNGRILFEDVDFRYRPDLPLILKQCSFEIPGGYKVGVTGRTGSGKSTIMAALFRLVPVCAGRIVIDGADIQHMDIDDLRSKITIIPQDTTLFEGTVRYNLDPLSEHDDAALWSAIDRGCMRDAIKALPEGLDAKVEEAGVNFSAGERQLLCMARALLRNTKVLIMDEATASIDAVTDAKIQTMIRESFKGCTLLIIAHRLVTIIDADLILCMDDGRVSELGSPAQLLQKETGIFRGLIDETGSASAQFLTDVAFGRKNLATDDLEKIKI